jgi:hypothetical protein
MWVLGKILAQAVLRWIPDEEPVVVAIDDTTAQHRGKRVYGKGRHRDGVLSTHSHMAFKWGHCWVVLAVMVKFPFARRRWALPVLVALYRPEELDPDTSGRHKTPSELARQLMAVLIRWFPARRFVFLGDGGYASHDLARSCQRPPGATLVSRFHPKARLYEPPPKRRPGQKGRTRVVGRKLPTPAEIVAKSRLRKTTGEWSGGGAGAWDWSAARVTGIRPDRDWSRCGGYSFATSKGIIATSISSRRT